MLPLPKPLNHIIQNIDAKGNLIAFTARIETQTADTMFAYVVDTVSRWRSVWKVPITSGTVSIGESAIRIVDTTVVVYWQEQVNGADYRSRMLVKGIYSEAELQSVTLSDVGDHRYQARMVVIDESDKSVVILALAASRDEPRFGIRYWRYNTVSGKLESVSEFLPRHKYLSLSDALISSDRGVIAVGSIIDVDPTTLQLNQSTSRGFICEYDSFPKVKRFLSMQDQRPSSFSSLCQDQEKLLVFGQGADRSHFVARIDEDCITSMSPDQPGIHEAMQHIGWYDIVGRSLQHPESGTVIELLQCSHGCYHSRLLLIH